MREVDGWILLITEPSFQFPISSRQLAILLGGKDVSTPTG